MQNPMNNDDYAENEWDTQILDLQIMVERSLAADAFFQELLDSVETLSVIVQTHNARTLVDLFYLHQAIFHNGFVDFSYPSESNLLHFLKLLPSEEHWLKYITVENDAESSASVSGNSLPLAWTNYYFCNCGTEWVDQWSCCCNDRCPRCNTETQPYISDDGLLTDAEIEHARLAAINDGSC